MTATREPRRGRPPKGAPQLSREAIVDAALEVVDAGGTGAVSMRSVARRLGVDPKSLYNHVAGKDDLLDAVAERLLGTLRLPAPTGDPRDDLRAIGNAFRERALAHPQAAPLVLTRQLASHRALAPTEAVLAVLHAAGCPPREAVPVLRTLLATLVGALLREAHSGPPDPPATARRRTALELSGYPHVTAAATDLAHFDPAATWEFTLDFAITALLARLGG